MIHMKQNGYNAGGSFRNILIIPSSIKSHVIPSIYLADLLADHYNINIMVSDKKCEEIVVKNKYKPVQGSHYRINQGMEKSWLIDKANFNWFNLVTTYLRNSIYYIRRGELNAVVDVLNPAAIFVDIFSGSDFIALHSFFPKEKVFFFNPMLSIYKHEKFPDISSNQWPIDDSKVCTVTNKPSCKSIKKLINYTKSLILEWLSQNQEKRLLQLSKIGTTPPTIKNCSFTSIFGGIPELILAPQELEFSRDLKFENQIYLGLSTKVNRVEPELDPASNDLERIILTQKKLNKKIVYCSFGTFYRFGLKPIFEFLERLIAATAHMDDIFLIVSVSKVVIEFLKAKHKIKDNIVFYSKVNQLSLLNSADLHITHGGLGSVKESIYFSVPMLVYPLDLRFDQNGNGLKVKYHKIGDCGVMATEPIDEIEKKIRNVLTDSSYKLNISKLNVKIKKSYTDANNTCILLSLIDISGPANQGQKLRQGIKT